MLPTQSTNAFVVDVAPLLILGALIVFYFIFKNHKKSTSKKFSKNKVDNSNGNIRVENDSNNSNETLFTLKRTNMNTISYNSNITKKEEPEDIPIRKEKEKEKIRI